MGEDGFRFYQGVRVQYASYCPCSAELCKHEGKGFPHAQRSFAHVIIETKDPDYVWLEDIISHVETSVKTLPYPIIKRADEAAIAQVAYDNPQFVEDAVRAISTALNSDNKIYDWVVKCIHEESIHTSEAIAINWKGVDRGFDEKMFL